MASAWRPVNVFPWRRWPSGLQACRQGDFAGMRRDMTEFGAGLGEHCRVPPSLGRRSSENESGRLDLFSSRRKFNFQIFDGFVEGGNAPRLILDDHFLYHECQCPPFVVETDFSQSQIDVFFPAQAIFAELRQQSETRSARGHCYQSMPLLQRPNLACCFCKRSE